MWRLTRLREYYEAVRYMPTGIICWWCWRPNLFFDDCGWICISPKATEDAPCCRACWNGEPGQAHVARWGVGDR